MSPRRCIWPDKRLRTGGRAGGGDHRWIRAVWADMIDTIEAMPGVGLAG